MRPPVFAVILCVAGFVGPVSAQTTATNRTAPPPDPEAAAAFAGTSLVCFGVFALAGFVVYCAPLCIALVRGHPNTASIAVVNILLGWSLVGWVVALAWAFSATEARRYRPG